MRTNIFFKPAQLILIMYAMMFSLPLMALDEADYDINSKVLTIPSVKIGDIYVYNAKLQLNSIGNFVILGFSETPPQAENIASKCTKDLITIETFQMITKGMTLDEVNKIIGCRGELESATNIFLDYRWTENIVTTSSISISFVDNVVYSSVFLAR